MKIGIVTEDGQTISAHFGRATHYLVYDVNGKEVLGKEMRPKVYHDRGPKERRPGSPGDGRPGAGEGPIHDQMLGNVRDCGVLITRGMGRGMYEAIAELGIRPVVTSISSTDEAVSAYLDGTLDDHPERAHLPHP
jgi:predicted Fe-Mo cluster-binding NifX family protein